MAHPPVPSVVVRTPQQTSAQRARLAALRPPPPHGLGVGATSAGPAAPWLSPLFRQSGPARSVPVRTNDSGFVASPNPAVRALLHGVKPTPTGDTGFRPKPTAKPHVTVTVHPSGKIEIKHGAAAGSSPAAPTSTKTFAPGTSPDAPATRTSAAPKPGPRVPVANNPATPQLSLNDQAQNILDPVKQSILDAINQRVNAQQSAITNYAKDLAGMMGQYSPEAGAAYGNAEQGQAAIDAALAQTLSGAGTSGETDLAGRLAAIDADPGTAARLNGAAGATTQGTLGAAAGRGAASLSQLVGEKANAQDYGARLPGLAGLYGLQATKSAQSQGTTDTANAVAQLEQKLPDVVQQLKTDSTQQKQLRFEHGVALLQANGNVVTPQIRALLGGTLPTGLTAKGKADAAKVQIEQQNANTSAENARVNAAYKQAQLGITETKLKASLMKEHATAKAKGQHLGLSAKDWENYNSLALAGARSAHNGTPDGTHPPISWQQFLTIGMGEKIPIGILIAQGKRVYSKAEIRQGLIPGRK